MLTLSINMGTGISGVEAIMLILLERMPKKFRIHLTTVARR